MSGILRPIGATVLVVGAVMAALAVYGWVSAPSITSSDSVGSWLTQQGSTRWRLSSAMLVLIGLATAFAGIALSRRRAWGFLLLATASMVAGVFPWILQTTAALRFAFEVPRRGETFACVAVAACSVAAYFFFRASGRRRDGGCN